MPNVDGKKFPYTPKGKAAAKDAAKKAALKNMIANKKANAGMTATPAMAYGATPKKAMSSDTKSLDKKFGR